MANAPQNRGPSLIAMDKFGGEMAGRFDRVCRNGVETGRKVRDFRTKI